MAEHFSNLKLGPKENTMKALPRQCLYHLYNLRSDVYIYEVRHDPLYG
jgi:predicted GNAT family N-acyltransferase